MTLEIENSGYCKSGGDQSRDTFYWKAVNVLDQE